MITDILQGKPLRHALHPFLVHFPIGLFVLSFILDGASYLFKPAPLLVAGAFYSMLAGLLFALVAAVPGFVDYNDIRRDARTKRIATYHMVLNLVAVGLYGLNLGLRWDATAAEATPMAPFIGSLLALGVLSFSGYLGGSLVYDYGVAVGRHRRQTAIPKTTLRLEVEKKPNAGKPEFVAVPGAKTLKDGETLRVELDKQIIVLARVGGRWHAFQEFCTHRFGPLSEGAFHDGEVECPWHRSCFNVRSGAVMKEPAKEPLKTWPVRVEEDAVLIGRKPNPLPSEKQRAS